MQEIFWSSPTTPRYQPATGSVVLKWDVWTIKPDYCLCMWRYLIHFLILEQKTLYYRDILTFDKSLFQIQVVREHFIRDYGCPWLDVAIIKLQLSYSMFSGFHFSYSMHWIAFYGNFIVSLSFYFLVFFLCIFGIVDIFSILVLQIKERGEFFSTSEIFPTFFNVLKFILHFIFLLSYYHFRIFVIFFFGYCSVLFLWFLSHCVWHFHTGKLLMLVHDSESSCLAGGN